jgi:hypothetical protein
MGRGNLSDVRSLRARGRRGVAKKKPGAQPLPAELPKRLPNIALRHGQTLWLLTELGFRGSAPRTTFYEYIKSLRKLGIPFEFGKIGRARRGAATYSYYHLMELALALTLRVYHVVPDPVLVGIIRYRRNLYRHYRHAYVERRSGTGLLVEVKTKGKPPIRMRGTYLDLQLNFSGGKLVSFGPPKSLSPYDALSIFAERDLAARALLPIGVSVLSERVVALALKAPTIRRAARATVQRLGKTQESQAEQSHAWL